MSQAFTLPSQILSCVSMTTVVVPLSAFLMFTFLFSRSADSACRSCADKLSLALLKDIEAISSLLVRSR